MIQVKIVTATNRSTITCSADKTIRQVLDENNVNYGIAPVYMDGVALELGQMDKTFSEIGITEKCMLTAVVKTQNA